MSFGMKKLYRGLPLVVTLLTGTLFSVSFGAQSQRPAITYAPLQEERKRNADDSFAKKFDTVWARVKERFYDAKLHGVDWESIKEKYRAKLEDVKSKADFADLMNRMLAELKASHTEYITDDDVNFYMLPAVLRGDMENGQVTHIGVMGHPIGKEYVIAGVLEGGPAEAAGIQSGDRLLTADGEPFTTAGSFRGKEGESVEVVLRREGEADTRTVTVKPVRSNMLKAFLEATKKSARVLNMDGKKIGYVHLWTMAHDSFRAALHEIVLRQLYDTDGLILDLRDGYGGRPEGFANPFFLPDVTWEQEMRGTGRSIRSNGYGKPMVVLINTGTRSAKEFFAYQFKKSRRATLVGTTTAGAFLGANAFAVGSDGLLELAVVGLRVDGKRLEGAGVSPDIEVPAKATYRTDDTQLARGKRVLLDSIRRTADKTRNERAVAP
jgi:carboxyl-terminal processing protease